MSPSCKGCWGRSSRCKIPCVLFSAGTLCPTDWYFYNGYCYYPSVDKVTFKGAFRNCQAMDADLVSISNQDEMDFVLSISYELIIITDNSCGSG